MRYCQVNLGYFTGEGGSVLRICLREFVFPVAWVFLLLTHPDAGDG